jgi:molecular chaperone GrpE
MVRDENRNYTDEEIMDQAKVHEPESDLTDQIEVLQRQLADAKQKYLSLAADLENIRRRAAREYENVRFDAYARILKPLLSILDDFDRALASISEAEKEGLLMIRKSFEKILLTDGVTIMEESTEFDPDKHEAVMFVEGSQKEPGSIVAFLQKGYLLDGKVLRHARVSVAK